MSRDELVFVLVKMTGFLVIVGAIFWFFMAPVMFFGCLFQIGLGLLIVAKSGVIVEWLFRFGGDGSPTDEPADEEPVDTP